MLYKFNKITKESQCRLDLLNMARRVNHDTDNAQHRLLIIQLPMIVNERLQVEDEENSVEQGQGHVHYRSEKNLLLQCHT